MNINNIKSMFRNEEQAHGYETISDFLGIINITDEEQSTALDIGCGKGKVLLEIKKKYPKISLKGVEFDKENIKYCSLAGIETEAIDLECKKLPYETLSMDIVVCNHVLEHLKNIFNIVDEVQRILKPNGYFIIGVPNMGGMA
jgi:2-polyprenyl-3-methyl-5-hydroxy-6-metoxy-1,4-benzoquinol methylase